MRKSGVMATQNKTRRCLRERGEGEGGDEGRAGQKVKTRRTQRAANFLHPCPSVMSGAHWKSGADTKRQN